MIVGTFEKQPSDERDIDVSFDDYLSYFSPADTIQSATAFADVVTLFVDTVSWNSTAVKFWVRGGVSGKRYKVTIRVITTGGRRKEVEVVVKVRDR